jgi:7-cyano-7-deazaguanine synthase
VNINSKAVVLLSGGLDSTTVLAIAQSKQHELYAMTFDYGQKNRFELDRASEIADHYSVKAHQKVCIDLSVFGGSSLTTEGQVEKHRGINEIGNAIPSTYVPARNTIFLSYALAWAEVLEARDIYIGVNAVDTSGYPDCRPEFIECFQALGKLGTRIADTEETLNIHAPLQLLSKSEIISAGLALGVDYSKTNTCYDPSSEGIACSNCDACILRIKGFTDLGISDPIRYQSPS